MSTDSNSSSTITNHPQEHPPDRFLIPRPQCRQFLIQFTCITICGWIIGGLASIAVEKILVVNLPSSSSHQWAILIFHLSQIVFATIFAVSQALILRPYLSIWMWIFATGGGWLITNIVSTTWIDYILSLATGANQNLSPPENIIFGILSTVSYIMAATWLGLLQWLVLRRYVVSAWRWIFVPSISFGCISIVIWLLSLIPEIIPPSYRPGILYWSTSY
jgi:hypothetical protein